VKLILEAGRANAHYWRDIWRFRELMYFLAWRDVVVRYKQTAIGVAWAVIRPALTMLVFVAFRRMVGISSCRRSAVAVFLGGGFGIVRQSGQ
jgi:lipopolysaccharide transport system permease protein